MLAAATERSRHWLPWALCALGLAGAAACIALDVLDRSRIHSFHDAQPVGIVLPVSFSLLGVVIVSRHPENRIGWIYLLIGVVMPIQSVTGLYYLRSVDSGGLPAARWAAWVSNWSSLFVFPTGLALFAFLLFPNSRLPSPRWRPVVNAAVALTALTLVVTILDPNGISFDSPAIPNPTGIGGAGGAIDLLAGVCYLAGVALIGFAIGGLVLRSRRAPLRERQQIKLLGYAAALTIASVVVVLGFSFVVRQSLTDSLWDAVVMVGFGIAVPAACGFAILRRGLFEIDRLISRTISYAIVTGLLVGTFLGIVVLATRVLPFSSPVAVAASTLAAAALFNPLRLRVQRVVDRRFNRARYDAEATVAAFTARARDAVDLDTIGAELLRVVEQAIAPSHASVWIRS